VSGSNLGREKDYPEIVAVYLSLSRKMPERYLEIGQNRFLSHPSHLIFLVAYLTTLSVSRPVFPKISATADHYMVGRRTRGPLSCRNIPLNRKQHATAPISANRRTIMVKVAIKHFLLSTNLNYSFKTIHHIF
jgi:hypothetical protein